MHRSRPSEGSTELASDAESAAPPSVPTARSLPDNVLAWDETEQRGGAYAMHKLRLRTGAELDGHRGRSGAAASTKQRQSQPDQRVVAPRQPLRSSCGSMELPR
jgi:hypothetical protein